METIWNTGFWSLHLISGDTFYLHLIFAFHCLVTLCFILGYRTRLATFLSFALHVSLQTSTSRDFECLLLG